MKSRFSVKVSYNENDQLIMIPEEAKEIKDSDKSHKSFVQIMKWEEEKKQY